MPKRSVGLPSNRVPAARVVDDSFWRLPVPSARSQGGKSPNSFFVRRRPRARGLRVTPLIHSSVIFRITCQVRAESRSRSSPSALRARGRGTRPHSFLGLPLDRGQSRSQSVLARQAARVEEPGRPMRTRAESARWKGRQQSSTGDGKMIARRFGTAVPAPACPRPYPGPARFRPTERLSSLSLGGARLEAQSPHADHRRSGPSR
jgi:hypothetical protein